MANWVFLVILHSNSQQETVYSGHINKKVTSALPRCLIGNTFSSLTIKDKVLQWMDALAYQSNLILWSRNIKT